MVAYRDVRAVVRTSVGVDGLGREPVNAMNTESSGNSSGQS
jgi:hypothetical protein